MSAWDEADANRAVKADLIARGLLRRGLTLADIAELPYAQRGNDVTVLALVRQCYAEAGRDDVKVPSKRTSDTWRHVITRMGELADQVPEDLLADRARWLSAAQPWPEVSVPGDPAPDPSWRGAPPAAAGSAPEQVALRVSRSFGECRVCGHPVRWATGLAGQVFALDREPSPRGRWTVDPETLAARQAGHGEGERYAAHPSPCYDGTRQRAQAKPAALRSSPLTLSGVTCTAPGCGQPIEVSALRDGTGRLMNRHPSCDREAEKPPPLKLLQVPTRDGTGWMPAHWGPFWAPGGR